jgi:hypothetical protein
MMGPMRWSELIESRPPLQGHLQLRGMRSVIAE